MVVLGVGVGVWQLARSASDTVAASGGPADPGAADGDATATGTSTAGGGPTTATASPSATPATASPTSTATAPVDRSLPVTVLNATGRGGLAGRVSTTLRSAGWTSFTGNGASREAVTTLYYPGADQQGTAQAVADDLGVTAQLEQSDQFGTDRITLVLGADFVG